jgi:excisionase family DNA binding protein
MYTVKETAERLGISPSKLYQLTSRKQIPHYRIGGKILFSDEDIQAYLSSCKVEQAGASKPKPPPVKLRHLTI